MTLSIRALPAMRLATLLTRGSPNEPMDPMSFGKVWGQLRPTALAQDLVKPASVFTSAFLAADLGGPGSMMWYAAALVVEEDQQLAPPLEELRVSAGRYAMWTHAGSYDGLGNAWGQFAQLIKAEDHPIEAGRPCLEMYVDDGKGSANGPRTELYVHLRA